MANHKYDLPDGLSAKVIKYCYDRMKTVNKKQLYDNKIRPSIFIEMIYDAVVAQIYSTGIMEIDDLVIKNIFINLRYTEDIFSGYLAGKYELAGVRDEDSLVFKVKIAKQE